MSKTVGQKTMLDVWNYLGEIIAENNNYYVNGKWGQFNTSHRQCFDCVCSIKACGWGVPVGTDITSEQYKYIADNKATMPDATIAQFYAKATTKGTDMSKIPTDSISFVYQNNGHIGVYNPSTQSVREVCAGQTMGAREMALSSYSSGFWNKWSGAAYYTASKVTSATTSTSTTTSATTSTTKTDNGLYRVRKSWSASSTQVGAYSVVENAIRKCDEVGKTVYTVYNSKGEAVYGAEYNKTSTSTTSSVSKTSAGYELKVTNIPYYSASTGVSKGVRSGTFYVWSSEVINGRIRVTKSKGLVGIKSGVTCWLAVEDYE